MNDKNAALPRMGGIALKNGLVLVSDDHWAAAIREPGGNISVASGRKPRLPSGRGRRGGAAHPARAATAQVADYQGLPVLRGLARFGETLLVVAQVKTRVPQAELPLEGGRVAMALAGAFAATETVRAVGPKNAVAREAGVALAAFLPAVLSLKGSPISGYHGAEHKVIAGREAELRVGAAAGMAAGGTAGAAGSRTVKAAAPRKSDGAGAADLRVPEVLGGPPAAKTAGKSEVGPSARASAPAGDPVGVSATASAPKEHDRCGSNLVGPLFFTTVAANVLLRAGAKRMSPATQALAGAASLGAALEALRWATRHGDSLAARVMMSPGRLIQKTLTTSEPTPEQLEVAERAMEELLRLEAAGER